jgi:hypothetical protein
MEGGGMARRSKQEYLGLMWQRYQRAGRAERTALFDEVTRMCRYHRKYALGLLNQRQPPGLARGVCRVGDRPTYSVEAISVLCQRSSNNPKVRSVNSPHPQAAGGMRWNLTRCGNP